MLSRQFQITRALLVEFKKGVDGFSFVHFSSSAQPYFMMAPHRTDECPPDIIDIRRGEIEFHLLDDIKSGLITAGDGQKSLPSMIFYDAEGLNLFEEITYLDEYYLTNAEIEVLEKSADRIALTIQNGAQVVELGSG